MKLDAFNKLKQKFELNAFENNFLTLDRVLYYFSFLGNIFSVIFSYFFIKNATDAIPQFFAGQDVVVAGFIIIFMSGYELLKRFSFQQLVTYIVRLKKFTVQLFASSLLVMLLVGGSFYLSLNGAHRLIDQSEVIENTTDLNIKQQTDSIFNSYKPKIELYQSQLEALYANSYNGRVRTRDKADIKDYESRVTLLEGERDAKIKALETSVEGKTIDKVNKNKANTLALVLLTLFMEFIILLGVGFNAYYIAKSYSDMKSLLNTPQYKQMETNLKLLHLLYQNGNRKEGEPTIAITKFKSLVSNNKIDVRQKDITDFLNLVSELDIIKIGTSKKKYYNMSYDKAKDIIEKSIK